MYIVNNLVRTPLPNLMSPFLWTPQYRAVRIVAKSILNKLVPGEEIERVRKDVSIKMNRSDS